MSTGPSLAILENNELPMTIITTTAPADASTIVPSEEGMVLQDEEDQKQPILVVVSHLPSSHEREGDHHCLRDEHDHSSSSSLSEGSTIATHRTPCSSSAASAASTSQKKKREDAAAVQLKVQETWRVRREERDQRGGVGTGNSVAGKKKQHLSALPLPLPPHQPVASRQLSKRPPGHPHPHPPLGLPMLCAMVQKSWKDTFEKPNKPRAKKSHNPDRPKVFPSMLSILEANALVTHVRDLQEEEDGSDDEDEYSDDELRERAPLPPYPTTSDPAVVASVLSILPAGYDWNKAILQMAQSRSRAFLLLDLAAIVRRTVLWKRMYPGITWVHSVNANANAKLLQVLLMAGVRLATTTRSDVAHALNSHSKIKKKATPQQQSQQATPSGTTDRSIADSTTHVAPPDSYLRELVSARIPTVTVDGPDEVHRVVRTVQRVQKRRGLNPHGIKLELVLRLHPADVDSWMRAAEGTLRAMESYPVHELTGISLNVGVVDVGDGSDADSRWSVQDRQSEAVRVKDRILKSHPLIKIHLTGFGDDGSARDSNSPAFPPEWVQWWTAQLSDPRVREVSVECSSPLIASAGALCARIIGVRRTTTSAAAGRDETEHKQHLYIDDGCYGSLYQTKGELKPIPLGNYKDSPAAPALDGAGGQALSNAAATTTTSTMSSSYTSTVWGPTCDGLDRVCRDIPLPRLERDDWLVFPNLGCPGGLGTAFNGFEPPDTAYCVLGYFKK
jgi:diaminopimelate decarboxylase